MITQHNTYTDSRLLNTLTPNTGEDHRIQTTAHVISQAGSPPVLLTALFIFLAFKTGTWLWSALYVLLSLVIPLLHLVWLVKRGWVSDLDVQRRKERLSPMLFALGCSGGATLLLTVAGAPAPLPLAAAGLWGLFALIFLITLYWKISVHSAMASAISLILLWLTGNPLPLLLLVPTVAWSRVQLRRHTVPQVVAGTLLSLALFMALFSLTGGAA